MDVAKIISDGDRQMVELPAGYSFDESEVSVRRKDGGLILEPIAKPATDRTDLSWLDELGTLDEDVLQAIEEAERHR